eukprot:11249798-Alexandrium_andersonii.AAC.1
MRSSFAAALPLSLAVSLVVVVAAAAVALLSPCRQLPAGLQHLTCDAPPLYHAGCCAVGT